MIHHTKKTRNTQHDISLLSLNLFSVASSIHKKKKSLKVYISPRPSTKPPPFNRSHLDVAVDDLEAVVVAQHLDVEAQFSEKNHGFKLKAPSYFSQSNLETCCCFQARVKLGSVQVESTVYNFHNQTLKPVVAIKIRSI